jgi:ABC-type multidrug transport system ATPase subunit
MLESIVLNQVSKRFKRDWIFKNVDYSFSSGSKTAILGQNGSGKSTLLKIISGYVGITKGSITWTADGKSLETSDWHKHFTYCAPYLELLEEFTLQECLDFHFQLKAIRPDVNLDEVLTSSGLINHLKKQTALFSSGMKQRAKLIMALCSNVNVYLLDEPCSNLDEAGISWYRNLIEQLPKDRTIIVASNNPIEYDFCTTAIRVSEYK